MTFQFQGIRREGYVDIGTAVLSSLPSEVRRIDVREPAEFVGELGHIEGAESVPLGSLSAECPSWPKEAPLLLICRSGNRSSQAARFLAQMGFTNVANLSGGMLAVRAT
jgi:rhodanese-related sulfurtransferase